MNTLKTLALLTALLTNTGCMPVLYNMTAAGTPINWEAAKQLKVGMTKAQTLQLMGEPHAKTGDAQGNVIWKWIYVNFNTGTERMTATFKGDKIIELPTIPD